MSVERWHHILAGHPELSGRVGDILDCVSEPDEIRAGNAGAQLAVRRVDPAHWLVVVYREDVDDGFVATAMITSRYAWIGRRERLWPK